MVLVSQENNIKGTLPLLLGDNMTIIKIQANENNRHLLESQSHRTECWIDGYIKVPQELEKKAWDCLGYCDLVIENCILINILPKEIPVDTKQLKQTKVNALSETCEQTIYSGLELELSEGTERFEYKDKDQTNIKAMFDAVILGAQKYPYQSEDGKCRVFTAQDIITLYTSLEGLRTAQLTYYHQLKDLVNTLETAEEINAVTYGQPLEGEYLQHYNEMLAVAQEQMQLVLSKVVQNVV